MKRHVIAILFSLISAGSVNAQSGRPYTLPWDAPGQALVYRSCGCADSCWRAEVREVATQQVKATLRCDCEALHFSDEATPERVIEQSCAAFDAPEKMELITQRIKALISPPADPEP